MLLDQANHDGVLEAAQQPPPTAECHACEVNRTRAGDRGVRATGHEKMLASRW